MRLLEYNTKRDAEKASESAMRALSRVNGDPKRSWVEGMGEPPGRQRGPGPRNPPNVGYATHAVPVLSTADDRHFLEITDEMSALDAGTEKVDGVDVDIPREGVETEVTRSDDSAEITIVEVQAK